MINRVKKWLGIEGVKLELDLPEEIAAGTTTVSGLIRLQSMHDQTVTQIRLVMIERYTRGRGKDQLVDEYELGRTNLEEKIYIQAGELVELTFTLPFTLMRSEMDEWEQRNPLTKGLARAAKYFNKVKSDYRIEAEALVQGTALNPFDRKPVRVKQ